MLLRRGYQEQDSRVLKRKRLNFSCICNFLTHFTYISYLSLHPYGVAPSQGDWPPSHPSRAGHSTPFFLFYSSNVIFYFSCVSCNDIISVPKFLTPCNFQLLCCYLQLTQQFITHPNSL